MINCERYLDLISRRIDGDLTAEENALLESHLAECESCRSLLAIYEGALAADCAPQVEPPAQLAENVMAQVRRTTRITAAAQEKKAKRPRFQVIRFVAAAACLAIVLSVAIPSLNNVGPDVPDTIDSTYDSAEQGISFLDSGYVAYAEISGTLPDFLKGFTCDDNGDGTYYIRANTSVIDELKAINAVVTESDKDSTSVLILWKP